MYTVISETKAATYVKASSVSNILCFTHGVNSSLSIM